MTGNRKKSLAVVCNLLIGIFSFGSWIAMAVLTGNGETLAENGWRSLKFFTVLSNLFNGGVSLLYVYWLLAGREITVRKKLLKLTAVTAVGLTFTTVLVFLGPLYGYGNMFLGSNLWMHLLLPLASFFSYIFPERGTDIPRRMLLWTGVPTVLYEIGYVLNMVLHGIGTWPDTNDFYGFMTWGYGPAAVIAVVVLCVTWLIAFLLWMAGRDTGSRKHSR